SPRTRCTGILSCCHGCQSMPSSTLRHGSSSNGPRLAALWAGLAAGPLAWAALLQTNYVLSYVACEQRHTWMLHLATAVALVLVALGALAAWQARPADDEIVSSTAEARARFLATGGSAPCRRFV